MHTITIRPYHEPDADAVWAILQAVIRAGETYALPTDMSRQAATAYWFDQREVFVAVDGDRVVGTYFLRPNQPGGGSHVANCGYMVAHDAQGRGVARAMGLHSYDTARSRGFAAMQYNYVVEANVRAVRLWQSLGMQVVGRLPEAFRFPDGRISDVLVMFKRL